MQENGLKKVQRPHLRETLQKPETAIPETIAGVLIAVVIALTAIAYWPTEVRKGTAASDGGSYQSATRAPDAPANRE